MLRGKKCGSGRKNKAQVLEAKGVVCVFQCLREMWVRELGILNAARMDWILGKRGYEVQLDVVRKEAARSGMKCREPLRRASFKLLGCDQVK